MHHRQVCEKTKSKPRKIFDAVHKLWKTDAEVNTRWISAWFMFYVKLSGGEESFGEEKLGEEEEVDVEGGGELQGVRVLRTQVL